MMLHSKDWLCVGIGLLFSGCGGSDPSLQSQWQMPQGVPVPKRSSIRGSSYPPNEATPPGELPETGFAVEDGFWLVDELQAQELAQASGKPLFIDFWAEWCEPCLRMQTETFADPSVREALLADYLPLRINVSEPSRSNHEQLERYAITHVPTLLIVNAAGTEIHRMSHYVSVADLLDQLRELK